jgi:hypothetical protein
MTHRIRLSGLLPFVLGVTMSSPTVEGQASSWKHPDGSTHWYEAVVVAAGIDWSSANAAAAIKGGYLATMTSAAENTFVFGLINQAQFWSKTGLIWNGPWVGGVQPSGSSEPSGGWKWGELEAFTYKHWASGKPDNAGKADRIHFGGTTTTQVPAWSDGPSGVKRVAYVIEYSGSTSPRTLGLLRRDKGSFDGYTLVTPRLSLRTFLLDGRGRRVNEWTSAYEPGLPAMFLPDGHLLRTGRVQPTSFPTAGYGGIVEKFDWAGKRVWSYSHTSTTFCAHHDIEPMPNGNILIVAWELKSRAECIQAGRNPNLLSGGVLWPDKIIEVKPSGTGGTIVWEWHAWDHLTQDYDKTKSNFGKVDQHPELIDINFILPGRSGPDWMHANSIAYNAKLDQIVLGVPTFSEIWILDHSTTTALAAGHAGGRSGKGGDLLYRWGNPQAYRAGTAANRKLFFQHDAHWIDAARPGGGNILIFNNGRGRTPTQYSSVEEIVPPTPDAKGNYARTGSTWGPAGSKWTYTGSPPSSFVAPFMSSAQRQPNGNTLICAGPFGRFFEVTSTGAMVWEYITPTGNRSIGAQGDVPTNNSVFRVLRYAPDYPAFKNRNLTPGEPYEIYDSILRADGSPVSRRAGVGTTVALSLQSAAAAVSGTRPYYQIGTSASKGLIPIDHRFARMGIDALLFLSLSNSNPTVFQNYFGRLDAKGRGGAAIIIPNRPVLVGLDLQTTFLVTDLAAPSTIGMISNTVEVRIR